MKILRCLLCLQGLQEVLGHLYHPVGKANVKDSEGNGRLKDGVVYLFKVYRQLLNIAMKNF